MDGSSIVLNVWIEAVDGREDELAKQLFALVTPTRKEPGCLSYRLHRDPENRRKFMFYEEFTDQAALDLHNGASYFRSFIAYRARGSDPVSSQTLTRWERLEAETATAAEQ